MQPTACGKFVHSFVSTDGRPGTAKKCHRLKHTFVAKDKKKKKVTYPYILRSAHEAKLSFWYVRRRFNTAAKSH